MMKHLIKEGQRSQATPQRERPLGREDMTPNHEGGYVWAVDDWTRLDRFLVMGTEGGSYYVKERALTIKCTEAVLRCIRTDAARVAQRVLSISHLGRAPRNDYSLYVLALIMTHGTPEDKDEAIKVFRGVARTGTHLLHFAAFVDSMRGWGRMMRDVVANWYIRRPLDQVIFQVAKYRQRDGWSHRDLLRLSHPHPQASHTPSAQADPYRWTDNPQDVDSPAVRSDVYGWIVKGYPQEGEEVKIYDGVPGQTYSRHNPRPFHLKTIPLHTPFQKDFAAIIRARTEAEALPILERNEDISWEMVPPECRGTAFWEMMVSRLPITALIRQLPTLTRHGILKPMGGHTEAVVRKLTDKDVLLRGRVHPFQVLFAATAYESGGRRPTWDPWSMSNVNTAEREWDPVDEIVEALNRAFHESFVTLTQTIDQRALIAVDISGSMHSCFIAKTYLSAARAAAALALVLAKHITRTMCIPFTTKIEKALTIKGETLTSINKQFEALGLMGGTDCAKPILYAMENDIEVDAFVILTDGETWGGEIHPYQALLAYRRKTGIPAKMVNVAFASDFTIADPDDAGTLDVVGFDTNSPKIIQDFLSDLSER